SSLLAAKSTTCNGRCSTSRPSPSGTSISRLCNASANHILNSNIFCTNHNNSNKTMKYNILIFVFPFIMACGPADQPEESSAAESLPETNRLMLTDAQLQNSSLERAS